MIFQGLVIVRSKVALSLRFVVSVIAGIHYVTLVAMIEGSGVANSGYSILEGMDDQSLQLRGFRQQANRTLSKA